MSVATDTTLIAKDFRWEMGHRLPFHAGGCQNIHGHSYHLRVVIEGLLDDNGMVMDYFDLKEIVDPVIDRIDHAFLCDDQDSAMLGFLEEHGLKHLVVPFRTTAENIAGWLLQQIAEKVARYENLLTLIVRVAETERTYAERSISLTR